MPAVSPTNLANWNVNEYYNTDEEFRAALADALHEEYQAIVAAGLVLQIDDPQLASHWAMHPEIDLAQCRKWAAASVEGVDPRPYKVLFMLTDGLVRDQESIVRGCYSVLGAAVPLFGAAAADGWRMTGAYLLWPVVITAGSLLYLRLDERRRARAPARVADCVGG